MNCPRCGQSTKRTIWSKLFDKLVCQTCKGEEDVELGMATAICRDEIPGGITLDNYGPHPVTFYSHSERRAYMKAHGLMEKEKFCPLPGSDKDPAGIPNPEGYVDDVTMRNRQALFLRAHNRAHDEKPAFDAVRDGVIRNLTSRVGTQAEAEEAERAAQHR